MPDSEPPRTPNWADYIDSLHVFNPPSLPMIRPRWNRMVAEHSRLADTKIPVSLPDDERRVPG